MRTDALYLDDMVEAAEAIARFLNDLAKETFLGDELRQSAVLQKLIIIGEAASRLSTDFRARHAEIEWPDIVGLRNIAVHQYFGVSWETVWNTATLDVPILREQLAAILAAEFPNEG
jgi:uncharacterized protein with HEPN domain